MTSRSFTMSISAVEFRIKVSSTHIHTHLFLTCKQIDEAANENAKHDEYQNHVLQGEKKTN